MVVLVAPANSISRMTCLISCPHLGPICANCLKFTDLPVNFRRRIQENYQVQTSTSLISTTIQPQTTFLHIFTTNTSSFQSTLVKPELSSTNPSSTARFSSPDSKTSIFQHFTTHPENTTNIPEIFPPVRTISPYYPENATRQVLPTVNVEIVSIIDHEIVATSNDFRALDVFKMSEYIFDLRNVLFCVLSMLSGCFLMSFKSSIITIFVLFFRVFARCVECILMTFRNLFRPRFFAGHSRPGFSVDVLSVISDDMGVYGYDYERSDDDNNFPVELRTFH